MQPEHPRVPGQSLPCDIVFPETHFGGIEGKAQSALALPQTYLDLTTVTIVLIDSEPRSGSICVC